MAPRNDYSLAEQALFPQRTIGNQAMLRYLTHRRSNSAAKAAGEYRPPEAARATGEAPSAAWDFSKIPVFSPDRTGQSHFRLPLIAPSLPRSLQPKLLVGKVNDPLEHEAERVADTVMGMAASKLSIAAGPPQLSRKCAACEEEETQTLRSKRAGPLENAVSEAPSIVHKVLRSPGQPFDPATRSFFEHRFSYDFSRVRIHADATASQSAEAVAAKAYTIGSDIVFRQAEYAPHTFAGRHLLAHELAHVVQQGGVNAGVLNRKECSSTRSCSPPDRCSQPDTGEEGTTAAPSSWWSLTANIDVEESDFKSALRNLRLGHTNVRFAESSGKQYTFGFYPAGVVPNENTRAVDGCVNHPDTSHDDCIDRSVTYPLSLAQYTASLGFAQDFCRSRHYYGLNSANISYTCTTFAAEVVRAAGYQLPSSASTPTTIYYQPVPAIDNPNTLNENLEARVEGVGSGEYDVLSFVEMAGPNLLNIYPWQEKARWIRILLGETWWISERDVAGVERICTIGMVANDLIKVRGAVAPLVKNMNFPTQRIRVEKALGLT